MTDKGDCSPSLKDGKFSFGTLAGPEFEKKRDEFMTQHYKLLKVPEYDGEIWPKNEPETEIDFERFLTEEGYLGEMLKNMDRVMKEKEKKYGVIE